MDGKIEGEINEVIKINKSFLLVMLNLEVLFIQPVMSNRQVTT